MRFSAFVKPLGDLGQALLEMDSPVIRSSFSFKAVAVPFYE